MEVGKDDCSCMHHSMTNYVCIPHVSISQAIIFEYHENLINQW